MSLGRIKAAFFPVDELHPNHHRQAQFLHCIAEIVQNQENAMTCRDIRYLEIRVRDCRNNVNRIYDFILFFTNNHLAPQHRLGPMVIMRMSIRGATGPLSLRSGDDLFLRFALQRHVICLIYIQLTASNKGPAF